MIRLGTDTAGVISDWYKTDEEYAVFDIMHQASKQWPGVIKCTTWNAPLPKESTDEESWDANGSEVDTQHVDVQQPLETPDEIGSQDTQGELADQGSVEEEMPSKRVHNAPLPFIEVITK